MILAAQLLLTPADIALHSWCTRYGIAVSPSAHLVTTRRSVAGRGVFAMDRFDKDDVIASIPNECVFHPSNAAECFPETKERLQSALVDAGLSISDDNDTRKSRRFGGMNRLWRRLRKRDWGKTTLSSFDDEDVWPLELTMYAMAACSKQHPWSEWIEQWRREDPVHHLICSGPAPNDELSLGSTVEKLNELMPDLSPLALQAALSLRLERFHFHQQLVMDSHDKEFARTYSLVTSRATQLDDSLTGIVPFQDMINHSLQPNAEVSLTDSHVNICSTRDICKGEEIFLQYTSVGERMDQNDALWALIQWGIPTARADYNNDADSR